MSKTTEALNLAEAMAKRHGVRMCDENGDTHGEELYCVGIDDIADIICEALAEPDMKDAIIAGNEVLLNEQAQLLRECRSALDSLIKQRPNMAGLLCGSTTLGNLRAGLGAYRPSGVMNGTK